MVATSFPTLELCLKILQSCDSPYCWPEEVFYGNGTGGALNVGSYLISVKQCHNFKTQHTFFILF